MPEQKKHYRVNSVAFVPKIHSSELFYISTQVYYCLIVYYAQGTDLWSAAQNLTHDGQYSVGKEIAQFLDELHSISDDRYDIGHYISTIPQIEKRMTIYQLEHELNQLIWNGKKQEDERICRINEWLNGKVDSFLKT